MGTSNTRDKTYSFTPKIPGPFALTFIGLGIPIFIASWVFIFVESQGKRSLFSLENLDRAQSFLGQVFGADTWKSRGAELPDVFILATDTIAMSVLAIALAGVFSVVLLPLATARQDDQRAGYLANSGYAVMRALFVFTRAVPELLWALIVVFIISPGIFAGAIALAIHNFGVIGRLGADSIESLDRAPVVALESIGASSAQRYVIGVLPLVSRQLLTFLFYRWEVIIRTTAVVGFVAASGIGYQMRLDLSLFRYDEVGRLLIAYVVIVWMVDLLSTLVRRAFK